MSRSRLAARVAFALALAGCGSSTSSTSSSSKAAPDAGPSTPANDAGSTSSTPDAGTDASESDACVPIVSTRDAGSIIPLTDWDPIGSATTDATSVILTPATQDQAGALWHSATASFVTFDMTAGFRIDPTPGNPGDGFAFAWVNQPDVPPLGNGGAEMAIDGLTGYAVVVDEYDMMYYPVAGPLVAIVDTTKHAPDDAPGNWTLDAATIATPILDDQEHFLHVAFDAGVITVHIDDELVIDHFSIPNYAPYLGRWGFGAGTGGASAAHRITRVSFVDPSTSCP